MSVTDRQSPPLLPELLTAHDVATHLLVGDRTLRRWEARGILIAIRVGGVKRYRADDVRALIGPSSSESPDDDAAPGRAPRVTTSTAAAGTRDSAIIRA